MPNLKLPTVPEDFASTTSSKAAFAKELFDLLKSATIEGINETAPTPYDLTNLQNRVEVLEATKTPAMRSVLKDGVNTGLLTVAFADIGTDDYFVNVEAITPDGTINVVTWSVVENSKKTNEVKVRIQGNGSTYQFLVTIVEKI